MASHKSSRFSPSALEKYRMQRETEYKEFHKRLAPFPTSFRLVDRNQLGANTITSIRNHLEAALKAGYRTNMETAQSLNLLSFVLFTLKDKNAALDRVNEALNLYEQHRNIVSLANKAYILWKMPGPLRRREAEEQITKLETLMKADDFAYLIVKAKAELAASYMRFGHRFNKNAIDAFNDVIHEGREPEVWNWKLARAVAYRHTLDLQHAPHASGEEDDKHTKVLQMLQEIADESDNPQLKANALAEMALVLRSTWDAKTGQGLCNVVNAGPMKLCKDALKCDENEPSVLRKVGQIFRYYKDVHSSLKWLKKAVELQPSSAAYHHLGLTYKAFATEHKHGTLRKRRGRRLGGRKRGRQKGQGSMQTSTGQDEADVNHDDRDVLGRGKKGGKNTVRPQSAFQNEHRGNPGRRQGATQRGSGAGHWRGPAGETHNSSDSETELKKVVFGDTESDEDAEQDAANASKGDKLLKTIKSPPNRGITEFSRDDKYVQDAIDNLKQAVAFSAGENSRALYDLALLYKALGDYDNALECLENIYNDVDDGSLSSAGPLDEISAYEQAGLIKQEIAKGLQDDKNTLDLKEDADALLNTALQKAFAYYSESAELRGRFADVFQSPRSLLRAVKESDMCHQDKRKERAKLLRLIHKHPKSLAILEKMAADPQSKDAECQVIIIKNHYDMRNFDAAVTTFQIVMATQLGDEVRQKLGPVYIQKMYLEAGRHALQRPSSNSGNYFRNAFTDAFNKLSALGRTSTLSDCDNAIADASVGVERTSDTIWDIVMLHETEEEEGEEIEEKAKAVAGILKRCCGLKVTRMDEDLPYGCQSDFEIIKTAKKSHLLVVLVGKDTLSNILHHQVKMTILENVPTAVLLVNGAHLPECMQMYRSQTMNFPLPLMNITTGHRANVGETEAAAIVELFSFFLSCGQTADL